MPLPFRDPFPSLFLLFSMVAVSIYIPIYSHSIGSSFTPSLAPFMVPKWLQRFQALYSLTMLFQGDDPSPGSSFRRRGNLVFMTQTTNT